VSAYYNEMEPYAAQWLRNLIDKGLIAKGEVDERSILDVDSADLRGFTQCHFFAGIGGWSLAARLAGWPDDRPLWTGSAPCQPFSVAGQQKGKEDERHLWPVFFDLIRECRPDVVFGEQVASAIGKGWLDGVSADVEGAGYACGAAVLGAHSVGSPHIRQRLYWVADSGSERREGERLLLRVEAPGRHAPAVLEATGSGTDSRLADAASRGQRIDRSTSRSAGYPDECGKDCRLGDPMLSRLEEHTGHGDDGHEPGRLDADAARPVAEAGGDSWLADPCAVGRERGTDASRPAGKDEAERVEGHADLGSGGMSSWSRFDLIPCADGKARRIEPGLAPLANGIPARVVRLRGYGNAIVPQVAAEFVMAYQETTR